MTTIVLTGDGARGFWQMATIKHLMDKGLQADSYVGISSGALVAFLFSQIEPDAIIQMAKKIKKRSDIFSLNWSMLTTPGIFTTKPIKKIITNLLENHRLPPERRVPGFVSYANLETGELIYTDVNLLGSNEQIIEAVLCSISIPGFVRPFKTPYVDAGAVEINPVSFAIARGSTDVTIVFGRPIMGNTFEMPKTWFPTARVAYRSLDLMMNRMAVDDLSQAYLFDGVKVTLIETPTYLGDALAFERASGFLESGLAGHYLKTEIKNL